MILPEEKAMAVYPEALAELRRLVRFNGRDSDDFEQLTHWAHMAVRKILSLRADLSPKTWAFIGSRAIDFGRSKLMFYLAYFAAIQGATIVSGGACGADQVAQWGADAAIQAGWSARLRIELPWADYEADARPQSAEANVAELHGEDHTKARLFWTEQGYSFPESDARHKLFTRNYNIVKQADIVIAWTMRPNGSRSGGTANGVYMAERLGVPVIELPRDLDMFTEVE